MANPIILAGKLNVKRTSLVDVESELEALKTKREEVETEIDAIETEEELETVTKTIEELEEDLESKENEKKALEDEIEELEAELEKLNNKTPAGEDPAEGERTNMGNDKLKEIRTGINEYVKTKGATRDFTSVEGGALIPEELLTPEKAPEDVLDLTQLVNVRKVNRGSGKYPVIKKSGGKMVSVAELEANPKLANPEIEPISYDIETYRGYIPVSQEVIDDADYDVTGLIDEELQSQELNTKNAQIATALKTAPAKAVTGLDGLKGVFNKDISKVYAPKAVISASLYHELDTTKDDNGRYLLQDNIASESGKTLFGKEVVVLDDDVIGTSEGDLVGFIGDPKAFITLFDRKQATVKWVDHHVYGELLAVFTRFDVVATDDEAGFYVTFTPEADSGK